MFAVLMAATLVVGAFATTTTVTQSASVYLQKTRDNGSGNGNGNTITIQKCKQAATQSGWDNNQGQECQNLICTHPGENATCVQEGKAAAAPPVTPAPVKLTCEQCFTKFLTQTQITFVEDRADATSLEQLCRELLNGAIHLPDFSKDLSDAGVSRTTANELIACLLQAGVVFRLD
jgi:hypothetical protein